MPFGFIANNLFIESWPRQPIPRRNLQKHPVAAFRKTFFEKTTLFSLFVKETPSSERISYVQQNLIHAIAVRLRFRTLLEMNKSLHQAKVYRSRSDFRVKREPVGINRPLTW
jgi:hypothetical protein